MGNSPKLVAVAVISDEIRTNGFNVFRRADISKLTVPDPSAAFVAEALRLRGDAHPRVRPHLASWHSLVGWACLRYPLVTIHTENRRPGVCFIGEPKRMTSRR